MFFLCSKHSHDPLTFLLGFFPALPSVCLAIPPKHQAQCCPRAFACAVPTVCHTFSNTTWPFLPRSRNLKLIFLSCLPSLPCRHCPLPLHGLASSPDAPYSFVGVL